MTSKFVETMPEVTAEVVSTNDATIAVVSLVLDGVPFIWTGTAKREPGDRFSKEIGERLALSRAFDKAHKQMLRGANGLIKSAEDNRVQSKAQRKRPRPEVYEVRGKAKNKKRRRSALPRRSHTPVPVSA